MARLFIVPGILSGIVLIFWLWALIDVITTDSLLIRNMQKGTWICLVVIVPTLGAVAWVLFGRPEGASMAPGGQVAYERSPYRSERRVLGPEDSTGWSKPSSSRSLPSSVGDSESLAIRERKLMEKEAELAKKEAELQAREHGTESDS